MFCSCRLGFLLCVLFGAIQPAVADEPTEPIDGYLRGTDWVKMYDSQSKESHAHAIGYLQGVADSVMAQDRRKILCFPANMSIDLLGFAVRDWYKAHPDWLMDQGGVSMQVAIMTSFACRH